MSTLYEKLGSEKTVKLVVEKFYERVLNDDRIKHFFEGVDMFKQKIHQLDFLTYAFEGSERYRGSTMREVHKKLVRQKGLSDEHFNAFVEDLVETLKELEISPALIEEAVAVAGSVEHRNEVLNRKSTAKSNWTEESKNQ
ncbi:MAG: group 1 truncated hemoglobin [Xenococcaceae cyanobacterium MO_167.B27]|nr:group 1 truncated hemoglobin [Xenococcaceae cyanobacterium MO_167.B27]